MANLTNQTMSLPQVGSPERKPQLKEVGRLPGSKFKMQYPAESTKNSRSRTKDVQAMRIRMENQSPEAMDVISSTSRKLPRQHQGHHARNQAAAVTTVWNRDIV